MATSLSIKAPNAVDKCLSNQSTYQNNRVCIIKSQKAIANMQNLTWKPRKEKTTKREAIYTITMVITSWLLWCVRVSELKRITPLHVGRDLLFIQVISTK